MITKEQVLEAFKLIEDYKNQCEIGLQTIEENKIFHFSKDTFYYDVYDNFDMSIRLLNALNAIANEKWDEDNKRYTRTFTMDAFMKLIRYDILRQRNSGTHTANEFLKLKSKIIII